MRLIDADVLKEKVLEWMPNDPCGIEEKEFPFETDIVASLMMEIEEAPTIERRPTGEWILEEQKSQKHIENIYICSVCRNFEAWGKTELYNFCPNCGADMRGKQDE